MKNIYKENYSMTFNTCNHTYFYDYVLNKWKCRDCDNVVDDKEKEEHENRSDNVMKHQEVRLP